MSAHEPKPELIGVKNVTHTYDTGASSRPVLHNISLSIPMGQSCAIVGESGSGKSTLLNLIGLLDQPTTGQVLLKGRDMAQLSASERAVIRNQLIGFVFQGYNLLPRLNILDNVALPLRYRGASRTTARKAAYTQLERVGLASHTQYFSADLSGGQRQRVAIARALAGEPALLLADEPTGNLDSQMAREVIDLLLALNREHGVTLVMVTHDAMMASLMQRSIRVRDGRV